VRLIETLLVGHELNVIIAVCPGETGHLCLIVFGAAFYNEIISSVARKSLSPILQTLQAITRAKKLEKIKNLLWWHVL